jgi:NAD(P)-dependent dehydrogenase (short-subunit alcohol dehydrogenase family)
VIVNIASTAGVEHALAGQAAYCASQAAVVGFGRECAREFAGYGIAVHTILRPEAGDGQEQVVAGVLAAVSGEST